MIYKYIDQARNQPARCGGGGLNLDGWNTIQARVQDFLKEGGGGEDIHKHPPLDIVRVTSSALRKIEKHPHSWTFTSTTPPLDSARVTSSTFQGGGGVIGPGQAHFAIGFQYRDKFKGGG